MPLNFQWRSGSGSATQSFSSEWEWECHSKNKGVLNPLNIENVLHALKQYYISMSTSLCPDIRLVLLSIHTWTYIDVIRLKGKASLRVLSL